MSFLGTLFGSTPPAPATPNLVGPGGAVSQQQTANLGAFNTQLNAGRVNQSNAAGSTGWSQDPTTGAWTQTSTLAPNVAAVTNPALQGAAGAVGQFNPSNQPTFNPAATEQGIYQGETAMLAPQWQAQQSALQNQLGAEGFDSTGGTPGGAQTAMNNLNEQIGMQQTNLAGQAQSLAIPQAAQATQAEATAANNPIMQAQGLLGLNTSANAQLPGLTGQAQTPGLAVPDIVGATETSYGNQMGQYNAQLGANANTQSGIFGLAGTGLLASQLQPSDIRLKKDIKKLGVRPDGIGVYHFHYLWEDEKEPMHTGVMAHEVEPIIPDAVITLPTGFKAVDYAQL